jgi:hypothetical protein
MTESKPARPPQVAIAGWLVVAGSVVVVLMAFSRVADLRSLETKEAIEAYLSSSPGDSLGLTVSGVQTILRIASMVAAACAATTAILGWQVLQRSRGARLALSLLAGPLFVTGFVGGGFASAVVTAAIVMLWFQPARDWFDGITRAAPERPAPLPSVPRAPAAQSPLLDLPPPSGPPLYAAPYAAGAPASRSAAQRPAPVVWACAVAWASTAVVFLMFSVVLLELALAPDSLREEMRRQNPDLTMSDADLTRLLVVVSLVLVVWSAGAALLTLLVWRGVPWAALALSVSAALSCLALVPIVAGIATVVLLQRPESRAWLTARRR